MKRLLPLLIIIQFAFIYAQSFQGLIKEQHSSKTLRNAQWSVYAEYTETGKELIDYNGIQSLAPASGLKVFTSSAGLSLLGENYRYKTYIYYDGSISGGKLTGNVYFKGGGDPTLGSTLVKGAVSLDSLKKLITAAFKSKGISEITGNVYVDESAFDSYSMPDFYPYVDMGNYYGAQTSALTIYDNLYYLYFRPGKNVGDKAEVLGTYPFIPGLTFQNDMTTGREGSGDNGNIYAGPYQFNAVLRGTIPAGKDSFSIKGSMPDPAGYAGYLLIKTLQNMGIKVSTDLKRTGSGVVYSESKLLLEISSPPLKDIVYIINKRSNNLYTEQVLRTLAFNKYGKGSTSKGIDILIDFLKTNSIPVEGIELYDGCGLSRSNTITALSMVKLLSFMTKQSYFNSFYNSLGIAGDPKDISYYKNMGPGTIIEKNARIKSGLITGVRSHSGYVKGKSGKMIAFSFIANNFAGSSGQVDKIHEKLLIFLAEHY